MRRATWFITLMAALACGGAVAQSPDPLREAIAAHQRGDVKAAIRLYREFLAQHPDVAEIRSNLGAALVRDGQFEAAIPEYREALRKLGANPNVRMNLALAYYKLSRLTEAVRELETVRQQLPDALQPALVEGDCLLRMGDNRRLITLLLPYEAKAPDNDAIAYLLGTAMLAEKQHDQAQIRLDRILRRGESAEASLMLGYSLYQAHDNKAAAERLKRAIELNPRLPGVHALYALALKEGGDPDAATGQFEEELKINPYDFVANIELTLVRKQEGNLTAALAHIARALQVRPGDAGALYQRAAVHLLQGKLEEARVELEQMTANYPNFTEAHVSLATVYYRLKRRADGDRQREIVRTLQEQERQRTAAQPTAPAAVGQPPGPQQPQP